MTWTVKRVTHCLQNWAPAMALGFSVVLLALAGIYSVRQQNHVDGKLCLQTVENRDAIRSTWNAARMIFVARSEQPEQVNQFFDDILKPIPPLTCVNNQPVPKEG